MSLIMRRRMLESQRRNGLNSFSVEAKPVESQLNYNIQNCKTTNMTIMPTNANNNCVLPMPIQHHPKPIDLEQIQHKKGAEGDIQRPNVEQGGKMNNIMHSHSSWTHSRNFLEGNSKNECPEMLETTSERESSDGVAEIGSAYYDAPMFIDPIAYQQHQQYQQPHFSPTNGISSNGVSTVDLKLAQQNRCHNANCMRCKRTT